MRKNQKIFPLAVGVTGGIGNGKTTVCNLFASLGAKVLNADAIAKTLTNERSEIHRKIIKTFGEKVRLGDGTLDRKILAQAVFGNEILLKKLNQIIHPAVIDYLEQEIVAVKTQKQFPLIVVEAALIYETRSESMFDYVIVVSADSDESIRRIMKRDGLSRQEIIRRMDSQMSTNLKIRKADFVLYNSGDRSEIESNSKFLYHLLTT